ncbi:McrB family protein [Rheinheimera maricola]|uniref:AAA family ATPase n=1 Tax=Rheinheimera maricola TaxID=2793282 RepID=A0ABS7X6P4_9GAMM|nr:AAA family ATPase [Rheinheimera maricola]MBZ9610835.1 AAA family ATPase [Rheinheimera maricola]
MDLNQRFEDYKSYVSNFLSGSETRKPDFYAIAVFKCLAELENENKGESHDSGIKIITREELQQRVQSSFTAIGNKRRGEVNKYLSHRYEYTKAIEPDFINFVLEEDGQIHSRQEKVREGAKKSAYLIIDFPKKLELINFLTNLDLSGAYEKLSTQVEEQFVDDDSESVEYESDSLNMPLNQILYGPPGTGKTYLTVQLAVDAAEPRFKKLINSESKDEIRKTYKIRYDELVKEQRIRFVTFHQSYGYEEFVEGLSAKTEGNQLTYFEKDGVFKAICDDAKAYRTAAYETDKSEFKERWLEFCWTLSEAESGIQISTLSKKTFFTITDITNNTIRFDKSKGDSVHSLSVKTLEAIYNNEKTIKGGLQPYYLALIEHLKLITVRSQKDRKRKNFVLIIDEINRGNISKIFGELITLVEPSKRLGRPESLEVILPYSGDSFGVPDNLYIIGTMNTADRSLALMDTALRRRFDFIEMMPDYDALRDDNGNAYTVSGVDLVKLLDTLNERIAALYDREHMLGHAFFMPVVTAIKAGEQQALTELAKCFQTKIIPLMAEYFFESWQKIRLVLADNRKEKSMQLIKKEKVEFSDLFGDTDDEESFDRGVDTFNLTKFDDVLWHSPATYINMYEKAKTE